MLDNVVDAAQTVYRRFLQIYTEAILDINKVIGKRLGLAVGRDEQDRNEFIKAMKWQPQTYYEARSGRRVFRAGELVAMARASGVPAWTFLDATEISKTVSLGDGSKPISSDELLHLVQPPGGTRKSLAFAAKVIRTVINNLAGPRPAEGSLAHQLAMAARLIEHDIKKGGSE
jgi:hypothetical protein